MSVASFEMNENDEVGSQIAEQKQPQIAEDTNQNVKRSRLYTVAENSDQMFAHQPSQHKLTNESWSTIKYDSVFKTEPYKLNVLLKLQLFNASIIAQVNRKKRSLTEAALRAIKKELASINSEP